MVSVLIQRPSVASNLVNARRVYRFIPVLLRPRTVTRTLVKRPSATTAMTVPVDISHWKRRSPRSVAGSRCDLANLAP